MTAIHELRVNVKSLAAEARFIREEIARCKSPEEKARLQSHKFFRLKPEARMAQLALAFVRGTPYRRTEPKCRSAPEHGRLVNKLKRFTGYDPALAGKVKRWLET